uniref:Uncharacterized protein n=1 Tax=Aegilops tauschii subsp. strangulata TaxID=200361 RepID=A0A453DAR7_AEGTS
RARRRGSAAAGATASGAGWWRSRPWRWATRRPPSATSAASASPGGTTPWAASGRPAAAASGSGARGSSPTGAGSSITAPGSGSGTPSSAPWTSIPSPWPRLGSPRTASGSALLTTLMPATKGLVWLMLLSGQCSGSAIFPHVLLKNVVVEMQFSREDGLELVDGYEPWSSALVDGNAVFGPVFPEQKECEVMMMVGLPASGKTTWAEKWVKEHPEKRFVLLGTNLALDQMKVPGLLRKNNYGERFDRLMDHATQIFNTLLDRAARIPRNYILDQTNVYKSARIRKLRPFANYCKIAVVVFPSSTELNSRAAKRFQEMGKDVPAEAVDQMTANFVLPLSKDMPGSKEPFDEVIFVELSRDDAQRDLDEMKRLLPRASTPSHGNFSNQMVSSAYTGSVSAAGPSPSSSFEPPMNYSYGQGVHAPCAPSGYSSAPHQIQSSYSNAPYQQQTCASYPNPSYPNTADQHQVHASYPSTADQHQVHTSYASTANQHQAYGSYPSTPLPGYGSQNAYGSQGYPSPYSSPGYATNIYQTPEPVGDYVGSGYGPATPVHAQPLPQAVHQRHDGASSWSSGSYGPYGQQPLELFCIQLLG